MMDLIELQKNFKMQIIQQNISNLPSAAQAITKMDSNEPSYLNELKKRQFMSRNSPERDFLGDEFA